jgi:hypothetical protein
MDGGVQEHPAKRFGPERQQGTGHANWRPYPERPFKAIEGVTIRPGQARVGPEAPSGRCRFDPSSASLKQL